MFNIGMKVKRKSQIKRLLKPQGGYLKIDAYLLNRVSHDFWRQIVTLFSSCKSYNRDMILTLKSFSKQFQSIIYFYFYLNVLKFELQYEWILPQILFSVDKASYNNFVTIVGGEPMISSVAKNGWNWNFANLRDLVLI